MQGGKKELHFIKEEKREEKERERKKKVRVKKRMKYQ